MNLTDAQLKAVEVEEPPRDTCIVAGPGSGKTTVLVAHFEQLVESGIDPLRILAITFTEKAASNMRDRLARKFENRPEIRGKLERAYVSTVDGFCTRLLKENAVFAGVDPEFTVMDENQAFRLQRETIDKVLDKMLGEQPERVRVLLRGMATVDVGKEVLETYDAIRASGVAIGDLRGYRAPAAPDIEPAINEILRHWPNGWKATQLGHLQEAQDALKQIRAALNDSPQRALRAVTSFTCNLNKLQRGNRTYDLLKELKNDFLPELEYALITRYYAEGRAAIIDLFARLDAVYRQRKQQSSYLDFGDLEEYAVRLLKEHDEVRRRVQNQFDRVLMDEFQDTNGLQAELMDLLRRPSRFYAVGDINQSIYGFRHANPEVFTRYRDQVAERGDRAVELVENFRSRGEILRAVEKVTFAAAGIETRALVAGRPFEEKAEPSIEVVSAASPEIEAQWVAARILEFEGRPLQHGKATFRDLAVLVRNSEVFAEFGKAFDEAGIPYLVNRGKGFYESREVIDAMHLLRVISNPRDEISMAVVLRSPFVGASDEALLRLKSLGNVGAAVEELTAESLASFSAADREKLARLRDSLAAWRAIRNDTPIDHLLLRAMDESGYLHAADPRAAANIEKFAAQARAAGAHQTLAEFVEEIEMLRASKPREPDAPPEDSVNAVRMMTVHAAKGLEFPIVFLAAMHKGIDTSAGAICFSPRLGLGVDWRHPLGGKNKSDSFRHAIKAELKRREEEEGNRLLYVAITRAEEHLVMSFAAEKKPQNWAKIVAERLPARSVTEAPPRTPRQVSENTAGRVELLDRPPLAEQHDAQATVTSIAMFTDCPRRYYLSRYLGLDPTAQAGSFQPRSSGQGSSADEFGLQVHAILAGQTVPSPDPEAVKLANQFRNSALGRRAAAAAIIEREFDFLMELEGLVLRGQIDLWFEERGEIVLVDYKTDRVTAADAPAHADRYESQLRLYAWALERLTGRAPAEAYIHYLRPNLAVPVDLRPSLFGSPEAAVREFRDAQERLDFPLREGEHCRTCPHFTRLCPARIAFAAPASPTPA